MGEDFPSFKSLCLETRQMLARSFPCPRNCGCAQRVIHHEDGSIVGVCQCDPPTCPNRQLTPADITPLQLSWSRLGRAVCEAFDLNSKPAQLGIPSTVQFASYSADAVPVILTIQTDRHVFHRAVAELVARLRRSFILLAPTSRLVGAACHELLANVGAGFFALESTVLLSAQGSLRSVRAPGELFARFTPEPKDSVGEDVARQTLALARALNSAQRFRKAPLYTVFLLYCAEELSADQIARRCGCARSVVFTRLKLLRQKLGRHPAELRQYSTHFERIEESLSDPRARNIYRKGAVYGDDPGEEPEE